MTVLLCLFLCILEFVFVFTPVFVFVLAAFGVKQGVITLSVDRHPWTGPVCSNPPPRHIIIISIIDITTIIMIVIIIIIMNHDDFADI